MMQFLKKSNVYVKSTDDVEKKVLKFITEGANKLQVVADFDFTLSCADKDGKTCHSSYDCFDTIGILSMEYKNEAMALFEHYRPIKLDATLSKTEKDKQMKEWYNKNFHLMESSKVSKTDIVECVKSGNIILREKTDVMFQVLKNHDIPILVFSAGLGDIIKEVLVQKNLLIPNLEIIANFMSFNDQEVLENFTTPIVYMNTKNDSCLLAKQYYEKMKSRPNVLLIGDSLTDADMVPPMTDGTILKIGFLNQKVDEFKVEYMNAYDIVIAEDETMTVVNELLENIVG